MMLGGYRGKDRREGGREVLGGAEGGGLKVEIFFWCVNMRFGGFSAGPEVFLVGRLVGAYGGSTGIKGSWTGSGFFLLKKRTE